MLTIQAPHDYIETPRPRIFLAGSIEMGTATRWQDVVIDALKDHTGTILNPRRDDWDSTWVQEAKNPKFFRQVAWELTAMDVADMILMYFDPKTKSPITLLELGLHVTQCMIVCCPDGYWRRGNVEIVCAKHGTPCTGHLREAMDLLECKISELSDIWLDYNRKNGFLNISQVEIDTKNSNWRAFTRDNG